MVETKQKKIQASCNFCLQHFSDLLILTNCSMLRSFGGYVGDIWTGSEGGVIKIWPWESIEKSLSLSPEERHMATLLVERSYIDLRSRVTVNGVCSLSSQEVKCLLSDNAKARVWCTSPQSFSLW